MCIDLPTISDIQLGIILGIITTVVVLLPVLIKRANEIVVED